MTAVTEQQIVQIERDERVLRTITLFLTHLFKAKAIERFSVCVIVLHTPISVNLGEGYDTRSLPDLHVYTK
jgi:hypothetical protein